jgi:hypothetical protein
MNDIIEFTKRRIGHCHYINHQILQNRRPIDQSLVLMVTMKHSATEAVTCFDGQIPYIIQLKILHTLRSRMSGLGTYGWISQLSTSRKPTEKQWLEGDGIRSLTLFIGRIALNHSYNNEERRDCKACYAEDGVTEIKAKGEATSTRCGGTTTYVVDVMTCGHSCFAVNTDWDFRIRGREWLRTRGKMAMSRRMFYFLLSVAAGQPYLWWNTVPWEGPWWTLTAQY